MKKIMLIVCNVAFAGAPLGVLMHTIASTSTKAGPSLRSQWKPSSVLPLDALTPAMFIATRGAESGFHFAAQPIAVNQSISIEWVHQASGERVLQQVDVDYYPTAICHGQSAGEIYVAGKYLGGNSLIERWQLATPSVLTDVPTGGEPSRIELQPQGVASVQAIYLDAAEGRDIITAMRREIDSSSHLLVKFDDWGSVYRMDVTQKPAVFSLAASGNGASDAAVIEPALLTFHSVIQPMRMADTTSNGRGAYYLTNGASAGLGCVLDTDTFTNTINSSMAINDANTWVSSGYGDGASRLPVH